MTLENRKSVMSASSSFSVLETTRKDFEALIGSATNSSSEDRPLKSKRLTKKVKRSRFKTQEKQSHVEETVELSELKPLSDGNNHLRSNVVQVKSSHTNHGFWYENEHEDSSQSSLGSSKKQSNSSKGSRQNYSSKAASQLSKETRQETKLHSSSLSSESTSESESAFFETKKDKSQHNVSQHPSPSSLSSCLPASNTVSKKKNSKKLEESGSEILSSHHSSETDNRIESAETNLKILKDVSIAKGSKFKLTIHRSDRLVLHHPKIKPMVVVHALEVNTGRYILNQGVPFPPQFTSAPVNRQARNSKPEWNQEIFVELGEGVSLSDVVFLFELLSEPSANLRSLLAWGFLRPISKTGVEHVNKKIQLQLFKLPTTRSVLTASKPTVIDIFNWFRTSRKEKYPATLHITLLNLSVSSDQLVHSTTSLTEKYHHSETSTLGGVRLSGQPFKLPTRLIFTQEAVSGALVASFNSDGSLLAVGFTNGDIVVYTNLSKTSELKGHVGNVYGLQWDINSDYCLLSCGADCSARIWNQSSPAVVLPHPAYVYCAIFGDQKRVITGCYDQQIRFWEWNSKSPLLMNTYTQHLGPVNSLCLDLNRQLYSADATGSISVWSFSTSGLRHERILNGSSDEYSNRTPINSISIHPSGTRLLVHYRGSHLCLLEPKTGLKLMSYSGIYNPRVRLTGAISPCGNYVVSGSEDGSVYWFDLERGDLVAILALPGSTRPIMSVAFHPTSHLIALCSLEPEGSLRLLEFKKGESIQGFSMTTFPRTVQRAVNLVEHSSKSSEPSSPLHAKATSTLDKLEKIFRKLDLVMTWSNSQEKEDG